jgi:hypothetical protein
MPRSQLRRIKHSAPAVLRGWAALLIVAATVVPIVCMGWTSLAVFASVVVGLNLGLWAGRDSGLASLAGAVIMPSLGLVITLYSDVQTFGPDAGPIPVNEIARHSYAASFHFADARVATEFIGAVTNRSQFGSQQPTGGAWRAAPVVPSDWTPADPVPAWAIGKATGYGPRDFRTPRNWQQPYRAAVRYVLSDFSPAQSAIARATERYSLTTTPRAPLLYWVEEPRSVIADERTFLAWVVFGSLMIWLLFSVGAAWLVPQPEERVANPRAE